MKQVAKLFILGAPHLCFAWAPNGIKTAMT